MPLQRDVGRSSWQVLIALLAFAVAGLMATLGPYADVSEVMAPRPPFEERPAAGAEEMGSALERIGPAGRALYLHQLRWDLLLLMANAIWLLVWLRAVAVRVLGPRGGVVASTLAGLPALADIGENLCLAAVLGTHPQPSGWLTLAGVATTAKFTLLALALLTALALTLAWLARRWHSAD